MVLLVLAWHAASLNDFPGKISFSEHHPIRYPAFIFIIAIQECGDSTDGQAHILLHHVVNSF